MTKIKENDKFLLFQNYLSNCVNTYSKIYKKKECIISNYSNQKQICFIKSGKAEILKTDIHGNTTVLKYLKANDICSELLFQDTEDEIYIISTTTTEVVFIDYYNIIKNCEKGCPFHDNLVLILFNLLVNDNKQQNEKIELLSQRSTWEKIEYFIKNRMNDDNIFYVTTSYTAIAEYLCVDRSNLMRELKRMEEKNVIKREKKVIKYLR